MFNEGRHPCLQARAVLPRNNSTPSYWTNWGLDWNWANSNARGRSLLYIFFLGFGIHDPLCRISKKLDEPAEAVMVNLPSIIIPG